MSGGADSVCLLRVFHEIAPVFGLRLTVLHLNHGLRGDEANADEEFVRCLAASLGLACVLDRAELRLMDQNVEQAGRKARYEFFARVRDAERLDRIATGHTKSDQAETVLYRLLRGSGTAGLSGIRPVKEGFVIRPLIEVERPDIEAWLRARGLTWREDATNQSANFVRNRIRHEVLPWLSRELNPAVTTVLARTAQVALDEEVYWRAIVDEAARKLFIKDASGLVVEVDQLLAEPVAVVRRVLRRAIELVKGDTRGFDAAHIERILTLARSGTGSGRAILPGVDVFRSFEWLRIGPIREGSRQDRDYEFPAEVPGSYRLPGQNRRITLEKREMQPGLRRQGYTENGSQIDYAKIHERLVVRNWQPGDHFARAGHSDERVKQMFQHARIPIWERQGWPIMTSGDRIVWARKFGPAADFATGPETISVLLVSETENIEDA